MPTSPPINITLTTDFGTADHFVGVMKGVIAGIAPLARVIDITHRITPYQILEGAFVIAQSWRFFPTGTIHVIVVDPGVGSARRPILAEVNGQRFIAPDNGVLSMIYEAAMKPRAANPGVRVISNPKLMAPEISRTFHGRDVFAPAAAHLACGVPAARFGKPIDDFVRIADIKPVKFAPNSWRGLVFKADRFGNLITNFHIDDFAAVRTKPFDLRIGSKHVHRLALTFSDAASDEVVALVGSSGYIEIAANQASAARIVKWGARAPVELEIL